MATHAKTIAIGAICRVGKKNESRGIDEGHFAVCTKVNVHDDGEATGDFEVYADVEHAIEVSKSADGDAAEEQEGGETILHDSFIKLIPNIKRSQLPAVFGAKVWKDLLKSPDYVALRSIDVDDDEEDYLIGMTVKLDVMFTAGNKRRVQSVSAKVLRLIEEDGYERYECMYDSGDGETITESFDIEYVREAAGRVDEDDLARFAFIYLQEGLKSVVNIIQELPKSKALDDDALDGEEVFEFVKAFDPSSLADYADVDACRRGFRRLHKVAIVDEVKTVLEAAADKVKSAGIRTWPLISASRLGAAIRTSKPPNTSGGHHPLANAVKAKASDGEFEKFLESTYSITLPVKRHPWFLELRKNGSGVNVLMGALESFLAGKGGKFAPEARLRISAIENESDAEGLNMFLNEWADVIDEEEKGMETVAGDRLRQDPHVSPSPFLAPHGQPFQLNISSTLPPKNSTETERSERSQLGLDAAAVIADKQSLETLKALKTLKERGMNAEIEKAVGKITAPSLMRLVNYDGELDNALKGGYPELAQLCMSLRDVCQQRLETAILGESANAPSSRTSTAFKNARLGRLLKVRLGHLIDMDDCGTLEDPLKQFSKTKPKEVAANQLNRALTRLQAIIQIAFPAVTGTVIIFFPKLLDKIDESINLGVDWQAISKWYLQILKLICKPVTRFSIGDSRDTDTFTLRFDESWLGLSNNHNDAFRMAHLKALSAGGATDKSEVAKLREEVAKLKKGKGGGPGPGKGEKGNDKNKGQNKDKAKDKAKGKNKKVKKGKGNDGGSNKNDDACWDFIDKDAEPDVDEDSNLYVQMIPKGHKLLTEWNEENGKTKDDKWWCFAHFNHLGGCKFGDKCMASHEE